MNTSLLVIIQKNMKNSYSNSDKKYNTKIRVKNNNNMKDAKKRERIRNNKDGKKY